MCGYMPIIDVYAREILDSAGNPAIEVEIMTEDGTVGRAAVPSDVLGNGGGASEICHLMNSALADVVIGENVYEQASIDLLFHRKSRYVGSLTRSGLRCVSMAVAVTAAKSLCLPLYRYLGGICAVRLPIPMVTLLYDVRYKEKPAGEITILSDVQEIMIMPTGACTYEKGLRMCMEVCRVFWQMLAEQRGCAGDGASMPAGQEPGSAAERACPGDGILPAGNSRSTANPTFVGNEILPESAGKSVTNRGSADDPVSEGNRMNIEAVFSLISEAVKKAGYQPGREIALAIDVAADALYEEASGTYVFRCERKPDGDDIRRSTEKMPDNGEIRKSTEEMIDWLESLCHSFPILSIVDGLSRNDREGWKKLTRRLGGRVRLVADMLFDAAPKAFLDEHREQIANAVLIRPDRFDTLTDLLHTATMARGNGYEVVFSYGARETLDPMIADLAVAVGGTQFRGGAPCRAEAAAKYNRLLRIEDSLGLAAWK
ncbi:MAG: hypothetical protein LUF30_07655 [Lachnospiraceae bacterium]|nr:hypothetical protein [Lachnospiraceae bacterium]